MELPKDKAALDAITTTAASEAVAADRKRRKDIMSLPESQKRQKLATTLADSDATVEFAQTVLAAAAEETISAPATTTTTDNQNQQQQQAPQGQQGNQQQQQQAPSQFERMMDQQGGAGVGQQGGNQPEQQQQLTDEDKANAILGDQAALTGHDLRVKA